MARVTQSSPVLQQQEPRDHKAEIEAARLRIESRLRLRLGPSVQVIVTDNRHTMVSLRRRQEGLLEARLHHMFLEAPDGVISALGRFLQSRDVLSSRLLDEFIKARNHLIRKRPARRARLRAAGEHFNLLELFHDLNRRFFGGEVVADITWGRRTTPEGARRTTIKLGSYSVEERLIRIHPSLDKAFVPRYFIEWIVYHEMLHQVVPIPVRGGRRCFHSDEFRARERLFPEHERASRWERENLSRILAG